MQEEEKKEEIEKIDLKGTLAKFVQPDEPELSQEEAIMKYGENKNKKSSNAGDANGENTEEQEHMNRVKKELLASLERVKQLAKKIYGDNKQEKTKKELKVEGGGKQVQKEVGEKSQKAKENEKQQERE